MPQSVGLTITRSNTSFETQQGIGLYSEKGLFLLNPFAFEKKEEKHNTTQERENEVRVPVPYFENNKEKIILGHCVITM